MDWLHPDAWWVAFAVPLVVGLFLWAALQRREALRRFGDRPLMARLAEGVSTRRRRWKAFLVVLGVALIGLALVGPRFGTKLREVKREGVDIVIALDVSLSMQAEDVAPNRLDRAKNEIKKMLGQLKGDRVGLVLFAGDAFVQCPLTTDYGAVRLFLDVADPSMIPTPGTDFGAALRVAMKAFKSSTAEEEGEGRTRALLFVSDGENHVGGIETLIEKAREESIAIFSTGVGETEGAPIPLYRDGRRLGYKKDRQGSVVTTRLEDDALKMLAEDGAYFRIARTSSSLSKITSALDRLDKKEFGQEEFEEYEEKYQWPLAAGLFLLFAEWLVSDRRRGVVDAG